MNGGFNSGSARLPYTPLIMKPKRPRRDKRHTGRRIMRLEFFRGVIFIATLYLMLAMMTVIASFL